MFIINSDKEIREKISKDFFCSETCAEKIYRSLETSGLEIFDYLDDIECFAGMGLCPCCGNPLFNQ